MPAKFQLNDYTIPQSLKNVLNNQLKEYPSMTKEESSYLKLLNKVSKMKAIPEKGHLEILKLLLYVEQYYHDQEVNKHSMSDKSIRQDLTNDKYFYVQVPDLDEDDPFVTVGDFVKFDDTCLKIVEIKNDTIKAEAKKKDIPMLTWKKKKLFNIGFKLLHYPIRCHHYAVEHMNYCANRSIILHPKNKKFTLNKNQERMWYNIKVKKNLEQKQAVDNIINKTAKPAPYILFGPPGTGKTGTIVEAITQIHHRDPSERVLVCTPSNAAADEITRRLLNYIKGESIMRLYSTSRDVNLIDSKIMPCANFVQDKGLCMPWDILKTKRIIISTLTTSIRLLNMDCYESYFSYIFIDEAGQATEPETLIPFTLLGHHFGSSIYTQYVLTGDPLQLGPVIKAKFIEHLLGVSMLERLMNLKLYQKNKFNKYNTSYITKLVKNYRSHDAILRIPNELFYENELVACGGKEIEVAENWEHLLNKKFPVVFHAICGTERKVEGNLSVYNESEINAVEHYLKKLSSGPKPFDYKNIGVVTPFKLQEKFIRSRLKNGKAADVEVGTVQIFQGQEKDVIILSTVRSRLLQHDGKTHIGFLSNDRRFNVSLTRAKCLLIVVGNPNVLKYDATWKTFLTYCVNNNACFGDKFSLHLSELDRKKLIRPAIMTPNKKLICSSGKISNKKVNENNDKNIQLKPTKVTSIVLDAEWRPLSKQVNVNVTKSVNKKISEEINEDQSKKKKDSPNSKSHGKCTNTAVNVSVISRSEEMESLINKFKNFLLDKSVCR